MTDALRALAFDSAPLPTALLDASGRILAVNPAFSGLVGLAVRSLEGAPFHDLLDVVGSPDLDDLLAGRVDSSAASLRLRRVDGVLVRHRLHLHAVDDPLRGRMTLVQATAAERRPDPHALARLSDAAFTEDADTIAALAVSLVAAELDADRVALVDVAGDEVRRVRTHRLWPELGIGTRLAAHAGWLSAEVDAGELAAEPGVTCRVVAAPPGSGRFDAEAGAFLRSVASILSAATRRSSESTAHRPPPLTDQATSLPGRPAVLDGLERALHRLADAGAEAPRRVGVISIDVHNLHHLTAAEGHAAGDLVLRAVAERLQALAGSGTVGRVSGGAFVVVCEVDGNITRVLDRAEELAAAVGRPVKIGDHDLPVRLATGVAVARAGDELPDELLRQADAAMHQAALAGPDTIQLYNERVGEAARARIRTRRDLEAAVNEEFELFFQPIVELASGAVVGAEGLIRWLHPRRGLLSPGSFIAVAEESGEIVRLGRHVLTVACRTLRAWRESGLVDTGFRLSVNVAPQQLSRADFVDVLADLVDASGIDPGQLCLEITESSLIQVTDRSLDNAQRCRDELGLPIAVDDFGTGFSSLAQLRNLPADIIKLDQSFVADLEIDAGAMALVGGVVTMIAGLGLSMVVEGTETEGQRERLAQLGCERAQGYLFSRPLPRDQFEERLLGFEPVLDLTAEAVADIEDRPRP